MLRVVPRAISVKNFKCLRDLHVALSKINIVVGPNGSGKTSLVEALYLFKLVLDYIRGRVANPFVFWWSYRDAVWSHDEKLSVELGIEFSAAWRPEKSYIREALRKDMGAEQVELNSVEYRVVVTGRGGGFRIVEEKLRIPELDFVLTSRRGVSSAKIGGVESRVEEGPPFTYLLEVPYDGFRTYGFEDDYEAVDIVVEHIGGNYVLTPESFAKTLLSSDPHRYYRVNYMIAVALASVYMLLDRAIILFPEASFRAREPARVVRAVVPSPWGEDLAAVILTRYGGRVPDGVRSSIAYALGSPGIDIRVVPTTDGRVFIEVVEDGTGFNPPSIPAGLLKVLAIELALDLGSPLVVVDEIENSLHTRAIHRVLDDVRSSESVLIATTHSPAVIDLVNPGEVVVMERRGLDARAKRFEDPEALAKKLRELGVALSEYLAYVAPES